MFHFHFALYIMFNFTAPCLNSSQVFKINFQTKFFTVYNSVKCSAKRDIYLKFIVIYFNRNVFLYTNEGTFSNDTDSTSLPLYVAYAITSSWAINNELLFFPFTSNMPVSIPTVITAIIP